TLSYADGAVRHADLIPALTSVNAENLRDCTPRSFQMAQNPVKVSTIRSVVLACKIMKNFKEDSDAHGAASAPLTSAMLTNMDTTEFKGTEKVRCDSCGLSTPSYDIVNSGSIEKGYRQLCGRCFNAEVAKWAGLERFENL